MSPLIRVADESAILSLSGQAFLAGLVSAGRVSARLQGRAPV